MAAVSPQTFMIVLSSLVDRDLIEEAIKLGVSGYLLKTVDVLELCQAAAAVGSGEIYVSRKLVSRFKAANTQKIEITGVAFSDQEEQI